MLNQMFTSYKQPRLGLEAMSAARSLINESHLKAACVAEDEPPPSEPTCVCIRPPALSHTKYHTLIMQTPSRLNLQRRFLLRRATNTGGGVRLGAGDERRREESRNPLSSPLEEETRLTFAGGLERLITVRVSHRMWKKVTSSSRVKVKSGSLTINL